MQLLANRGYAVLQVNYRGSTGFGLKFLNAGTNEWGRGTQEDLFDAVKWAIDQGTADPKRIAAMGWSGGGFATLLALEMRPEMFACGIDGVGPADLATLFRSFPSYWSNIMTRWRRRGGDFDHNEKLNREVSPLFHVDKIRAPLLIGQGQNDPRVTIANSDAMVAALRKAKREVIYVVYPDEGHGFARPENNLDFYGRVGGIPCQTSRRPGRAVEKGCRRDGGAKVKSANLPRLSFFLVIGSITGATMFAVDRTHGREGSPRLANATRARDFAGIFRSTGDPEPGE